MRHSIVFGIAIISILSIFSSCKSEKTEALLAEIEGMQSSVDSSQKIFEEIDIEKITKNKENAKGQIEYLKKFYNDTNYVNARYVDVYISNFKLMRKLVKGHHRLDQEIDFSQGQLHHLRKDVKNGFAADSSYFKYLEAEKLAVSKIKNTTKTLVSWELKTTNRYNGMVAPIDSIITELKNQGKR